MLLVGQIGPTLLADLHNRQEKCDTTGTHYTVKTYFTKGKE